MAMRERTDSFDRRCAGPAPLGCMVYTDRRRGDGDLPRTLLWLSLDRPEDYDIYRNCWEASTFRRPHDHPGFLELVRPDNYRSAVVIYRHADRATVSYPFFHCEINGLPAFRSVGRPLRHLVSPYGYGGALYEGDAALRGEASESFERLLNAELRKLHFVTEFVREDIFPSRLALRSTGSVEQQPNVVVRLDRAPEEIWRGYKHSVRGNVNRAKKSGLRVEFDLDGEHLDRFLRIYYETMERRGAADNFFFARERFSRLGETLGKDGGVMYAHVYDGDEVVSSELVLLSQDTMYSFLGGSLASAFAKRPNNLLKHEVILWGQQHGYKWLVLGGGVTAGDELLRYKQSFDPENVVPFSVRRVVHDEDAYALLLRTRTDFERSQGRDWQPRPGFFPEYLSDHDRQRPSLVAEDSRSAAQDSSKPGE